MALVFGHPAWTSLVRLTLLSWVLEESLLILTWLMWENFWIFSSSTFQQRQKQMFSIGAYLQNVVYWRTHKSHVCVPIIHIHWHDDVQALYYLFVFRSTIWGICLFSISCLLFSLLLSITKVIITVFSVMASFGYWWCLCLESSILLKFLPVYKMGVELSSLPTNRCFRDCRFNELFCRDWIVPEVSSILASPWSWSDVLSPSSPI